MIKGNDRYLLLKYLEENGITHEEAYKILAELIEEKGDKK